MKKLEYKSGDKDWVANPVKGNSDIPKASGVKKLKTPEGTGHSITGFDTKGVKPTTGNNSAKKGSKPVYEESPAKKK